MAEHSEAGPQVLPEVPNEPQPHSTLSSETNAREATELARLRRRYTDRARSRSPGLPTENKPASLIGTAVWIVKKFWRHQISIIVDHDFCRDHLALERTFLAYLRTSLALSMIGVTLAQLFRLQNSPPVHTAFDYYVLGKPLSGICQGAAIYTLTIGAFRTWRTQNAMVRGKAISGGYEVVALAAGILLILVMFFALLIAVDVAKEAT